MEKIYDVAIIGCGIVGSALAYELSKYELDTAVIEKENDICCGATRANSAIIHAGFDPIPDSYGEAQCNGLRDGKGNMRRIGCAV